MAVKQTRKGRRKPKPRRRLRVTHRAVVLLEAVLLLGLLEEGLEEWLLSRQGLSPPLRVLAAMTLSLGLLGGMAVLLRRYLATGLEATQKAARRLPIPVPRAAVHAGVLLTIFMGYAWVWNDQTGAVEAVVQGAWSVGAGVAEAVAGP